MLKISRRPTHYKPELHVSFCKAWKANKNGSRLETLNSRGLGFGVSGTWLEFSSGRRDRASPVKKGAAEKQQDERTEFRISNLNAALFGKRP